MKKLTFEDIENRGLLLFKYLRGSKAYGTATPTSDIDEGAVYMCPVEQLLGLGLDYQDQVANETNDIVWYELNKFMRLLLNSNPTILEALFVPDDCIMYEHPIMTKIREHRDMFLTKKCFNSFGSYAASQIKKCTGQNKLINNPIVERKGPLDFAYTFYKQGSSNIKNWLEYRALNQKYCGLVNIPNMHDIYGCYYDWGNFFLNENLTKEFLWDCHFNTPHRDIRDIVDDIKKNGETTEKKEELRIAQYGNMVSFIINFYGLEDTPLLNLEEHFYIWYDGQKPIGYKGMVGEDGLSNELRLSSVSKGAVPICHIAYNQQGYQKHCIDFRNYTDWVKHRNPVRYENNLGHKYDAKNVSHCFRLIEMCIEIAQGKGFNVRRTYDRQFLLDVKNHIYSYEEVMEMLTEKEKIMKKSMAESTLPDDVSSDEVNDLLLEIRKMQLNNFK